MLVSERLQSALNRQIGRELDASIQYIAVGAWFDSQTLPALASFFYRQSDEERDHAMRILRFLVGSDCSVRIPQIEAPQHDFDSVEDAVRSALQWEEEVTRQYYQLVDLVREEQNHIADRFLAWFVDEQYEEVSLMSDLLRAVEHSDGNMLVLENFVAREYNKLGTELQGQAAGE